MPLSRQRPPPLVPALSLTAPWVQAAGVTFCGERTSPTVPSDLANGISDQSLEYMAQQPASMLTCSRGYLLEKCGDHAAANMVFDKCIAAGYAGAMIWKARLLEEGAGVEQDAVKATELLHRAAVSGDPAYAPIAKMHYATALHLGRGVAKNEAEARKWFETAAAEGSEEARDFPKTGYHTGSRDYDTLGAGTPTAAALAKSLPATQDDQPRPAQPASTALQGRKLINDAHAAPPAAAAAPPPAPPQPAATSDVQGQRLTRRAAPPAASLPQASAGLGLVLLVSFLAGMLRRRGQDRTAFTAQESLS